MDKLFYQNSPNVIIATNQFIDVPIIIQYENLPIFEIIKEEKLGFTSRIPIFHPDGTKLAKIIETRVYPTKDGIKSRIKIIKEAMLWSCSLDGKTLFEIRQDKNSFRFSAELYTNDGYFLKCNDSLPMEIKKGSLTIGGITFSNNKIIGSRIGIRCMKDGSIAFG